ncbi:hypothetical protein Tco_1203716 [Tanacetum coccineum]
MDYVEKFIAERELHKRAQDNKVVIESSETESEKYNESSRSGNDTRAEGEVDQDVEQRLDKRPLLASVIENKTTESINQTLESKINCLKKTIAQLQKDFSKLDAQSIAFEIA